MEIVRGCRLTVIGTRQWNNVGNVYSWLIPFRSLKTTLREQEGFYRDDHPQPVKDFLFDEQVCDSRFVFEGDETVALRRSRSLPADCHSCHGDGNAVREGLQIPSSEDFAIRISHAP